MDSKPDYDFDFFVIGGGSGGLSASKQAANYGKKVGLADYVKPSPLGTTWGLGGTCVNVGCIPKKLMHHSALMYEQIDLFTKYGYPKKIEKEHVWNTMVQNIQLYIKKLNFGYKTELRSKQVNYYNATAKLIDDHKILLIDSNGNEQLVTSETILVSIGGRPNYSDVPGSKECCITSDDIFSLKKSPGKTLIVGGSYIALECGGFLSSLGYETSIMVRSILLRGFDQDIANRIGNYMETRNVKFIYNAIPTNFYKTDAGKINVEYISNDKYKVDTFDTVLLAIGRVVDSKSINADKIGLNISKNGKLITNKADQTNIKNIYSIGDCAYERPELTPPAIMAGKLLAKRLYGKSKQLMNYKYIATTIFTPLEYGCVGYTEEEAFKLFGENSIKVFHSEFTPLEWQYDLLRGESGYLKIIVNSQDKNKVIGFHLLSPNAGEITQGISVAMNAGLTKEHLDNTVGIHPTVAEVYTRCMTEKGTNTDINDGC